MAYEIDIDGQRYMVDESSLDKYRNPETGELQVDIFTQDLQEELGNASNQTGMSEETKATFQNANKELQQFGLQINRGNNIGGAARNFAMGAIPGTAEAEAALRATKQKIEDFDPTIRKPKSGQTWNEAYDKYLENARESREGYKSANPTKALALQISGGIAGSLLPFGVATKATKLPLLARTGLAGTGTGAAFGFGNSQGGFENRLTDALTGGLVGGGIGVAAPIAAYGVGGLRNTISRVKGGYGAALPQEQIENFMLSETLKPTTESRSLAATLGYGAARGAKDIEKAGYELLNMRDAMNNMVKPSAYTGKTSGGTTAKEFLKATQHPSLTKAKQDFGDFVESLPTLENPHRTIDSLLSDNQTAINVLNENSKRFVTMTEDGIYKVMDPSDFGYWQTAQQVLTNKLPKRYDPSKLTGAKKEIYDAVQKISKTRNELFPGTQKVNAEYASAIADQKALDKQVNNRLQTMSRMQEPMSLPGGAIPTIGFVFGPPRQRGLARELIRTGQIREPVSQRGYQTGGALSDSIIRSLFNFAK